MEILLYFLLLGVIPVVSLVATKRVWLGYLVACLVGCPVLVARMLYMEQHAPDREFDFVFLVSLVLWSVILCVIYVPYAIVVGYVRKRRLKKAEVRS
jgi:heme/copper-type cytochrome/quinol oxidase subunit 2